MIIDKLNEIKYQLKIGAISYDEAKEKATPVINEFNAISKEKAKNFTYAKYRPITFSGFMR